MRYRGRDVEPILQVFVPYLQNPYRSVPYPQAPFVSFGCPHCRGPRQADHRGAGEDLGSGMRSRIRLQTGVSTCCS